MLRNNFDRLRDESRDQRERRDARDYYLEGNDSNYNSSQYDQSSSSSRDYNQQQNRNRNAHNDFSERTGSGDYYNQQNQANRGWAEKTSDEVSSWFGDRDARRRREMDSRTNQSNQSNVQNYVRDDSQHYSRDTERHWAGSYNQTESNPFYPASNRIYENDQNESQRRGLMSRGFTEQNYQNRSSQNQHYNQNYQQPSVQTMRARDVMSRNVVTVLPNDTVQHAARLMRDCDCGAIPVVDRQGRMVGMVTDRDITVRIVAGGSDPRVAQIQDCMTDQIFACHENDSLEICINAMSQHQVRRVAIVDNQNRVVGIISQGDLARHAQNNRNQHDEFTNMLGEISEPSRNPYR